MAKPKKTEGETPLLDSVPNPTPLPAPAPESIAAPPAILEYTPVDTRERWRVERFAEFVTEFNFGAWAARNGLGWERAMVLFHEAASGYSRGWQLARRLFGIMPCILPETAAADEGRTFTRKELADARGLSAAELTAELTALRGWSEKSFSQVEVESAPVAPVPARPGQQRLLLDDELLRKHGFPDSMFEVQVWKSAKEGETPRAAADNKQEREWFAQKVREWDRMLTEPYSHSIAREALMSDLYLRRVALEMSQITPSHPRFKELSSLKKDLEKSFSDLRRMLQEMFPSMNIAGRETAQVWMSELVRGWRAYKLDGNTKILDGVRTAAELAVDLTASVQAPDITYRMGWTLAVVEAQHGLHDPEFRSKFPMNLLKRADQGFKRGVEEMREAQGAPLVDMEKGVHPGEGDEFPDLPDNL